jgi:hypothetical protein
MLYKNKRLTYRELVKLLLKDAGKKWTREAAEFLADWYTEQENDWGLESTLDLVAIRSDWMEFDDLAEARANLRTDATDLLNNWEFLEYLHDETTVFELENGHYIIQNF